MARADAAGYEALVFTTDANVFGQREWDRRNYLRPGRADLAQPAAAAAASAVGLGRAAAPWRAAPDQPGAVSAPCRLERDRRQHRDPETVLGLHHLAGRGLVAPRVAAQADLKGVLSVPDARLAADHGCDGIILTNHGGRQLDHCVSGLDVLPQIAAAVGDRLSILVDGGIRRGTDVIKALALGADAVLLARATLYGLAAGGERGVAAALEILTTEIDRALGHLGCNGVADLTPAILRLRR